jgi:hypothetical protein
MAIVVLSDTPDMTSDQYDAVAAELGLRDSLPDGCRAYLAGLGPDGSGWREVSVFPAHAFSACYPFPNRAASSEPPVVSPAE